MYHCGGLPPENCTIADLSACGGLEGILKQLVDYLKIMLDRDYNYPSSALWRAVELDLLSKQDYPRGSEILDLGCGDGFFSRCLFGSKGLQITSGLDVSKRYVSKARKNDHNPQVYKSFKIASAKDLPYDAQTFDLVFSNCVIEHIPGVQQVLHEVARVLKKNGRFIFTVPSPQFGCYSYVYRFFNNIGLHRVANCYRSSLNKRLCHYNIYSPEEWRILLNNAGLEVELSRYYMSRRTAFLCDVLEFIYTLGIWKIRLHAFLIRAGRFLERIGISIHKKLTMNAYYRFLKKYYDGELAVGNSEGAAILVVAARNDRYGSEEH